MQFDIQLRNNKINSYRLITLLIFVLNFLYFTRLLFDHEHRSQAIISVGTLIAYVVFRIVITRKKRISFFIDEWAFFVLMLLWIDSYLLASLNLFFMLMYTIATQDIRYEFGEKVIQKHFPWKKFEWSAFSNVILKDNILTMDFYNNKTLQEEVINEVGEIDFNNFVIKKLDGDKLIN